MEEKESKGEPQGSHCAGSEGGEAGAGEVMLQGCGWCYCQEGLGGDVRGDPTENRGWEVQREAGMRFPTPTGTDLPTEGRDSQPGACPGNRSAAGASPELAGAL